MHILQIIEAFAVLLLPTVSGQLPADNPDADNVYLMNFQLLGGNSTSFLCALILLWAHLG